MSKFSINKLPKKERIRLIGEFYDVIGSIKNREEASKVFRDILDGNEIGNIMRRIDVAVLLKLGFNYEEITDLLSVGKDKVSKVQKKLEKGGEGYDLIIKRILNKRKKKEIQSELNRKSYIRRIKRPDIGAIKKKAPNTFFLWSIIDNLEDYLEVVYRERDPKKQAQEYYKNKEK